MNKPDWSKAPEGATHWGPRNKYYIEAWYRYGVDKENKFMDAERLDGWQYTGVEADRYAQLIPRPTKPRYIAHYGGECPVCPETRVEAVHKDGRVGQSEHAQWYSMHFDWWKHQCLDPMDAIIAYRVLKDGE